MKIEKTAFRPSMIAVTRVHYACLADVKGRKIATSLPKPSKYIVFADSDDHVPGSSRDLHSTPVLPPITSILWLNLLRAFMDDLRVGGSRRQDTGYEYIQDMQSASIEHKQATAT